MSNIIGQKSQERDWRDGMFLGHQFMIGQKRFGDKRCDYCGIWFHWKASDMELYAATENWKVNFGPAQRTPVIVNGKQCVRIKRKVINGEPIHCGSEHCKDYHHRGMTKPNVHKMDRAEKYKRLFDKFKRLKKRGLVS